jgi:hypothetical protein
MKKSAIVFFVSFFFLIVVGTIGYLFFRVSTSFISGIDGNNLNTNYIQLTKNYYLLKTENTIWGNSNNTYKKVSSKIDSLNWNEQTITGYSNAKYFTLNLTTQDIDYFPSKDSLIKALSILPPLSLKELPAMQQ